MKTRNNIFAILAAAAAMVCSCDIVPNDKMDIFDESVSARTEQFIDEAKSILTENTHGWIMEYYPGTSQKYGGYAYVLRFTEEEVEAFYEVDTEHSFKSIYKFTKDNGAVLSFDTYNPALHHFATPSSSAYQAMGGDFEFMITSVSKDLIGLEGKRSHNHCNLRPLPEDITPEEFCTGASLINEGFRASEVEGTIGDTNVSGIVDLNNRRITFTLLGAGAAAEGEEAGEVKEAETVTAPFMFTDSGLRLYDAIKIGGCTFQDLQYHEQNNLLTNGVFILNGKLPEDYTNFSDFAGDYVFVYYNTRTLDVTLTPKADRSGYTMSGFNPNFDVNLVYDRAKGRLLWNVQTVGTSSSNHTIKLAAWDLNGGGNLTWSEDAGCTIYWDKTENVFKFEDNGNYEGIKTDSWIIWDVDARTSFSEWGNPQYPYINYLRRK